MDRIAPKVIFGRLLAWGIPGWPPRIRSAFSLLVLFAGGGLFAYQIFHPSRSEHALLNSEAIAAIGFLLLLSSRTWAGTPTTVQVSSRFAATALVSALLIGITYWKVVTTPFIYDDYTHVSQVSQWTWRTAVAEFGPVANKPGLFFRPLFFLLSWLYYLCFGANAPLWHIASLVIHALNCCLLYLLCRAMGLDEVTRQCSALMFAVNAVSTETVAWIDARGDLIATCLVLAALLCSCRFAVSHRRVWLLLALVACGFAVLTKESAFSLPLLIACLAAMCPVPHRPKILLTSAWSAGLCSALFGYRWIALGGIGGYGSGSGPEVVQFNVLHALNAIFVREFAVLLFPVNWSLSLNQLLQIALLLTPVMLGVCGLFTQLQWRRLAGCIGMTLAASLPVHHLLLIGSDLGNSRLLYLPSVGYAMLWGVVLSGIRIQSLRVLAMGWLLVLQGLMLEHNLYGWRVVPELARSVCAAFGHEIGPEGLVYVSGLPRKRTGVVFLANGFPECVETNSGTPRVRVRLGNGVGEPGRRFLWNEEAARLELDAQR